MTDKFNLKGKSSFQEAEPLSSTLDLFTRGFMHFSSGPFRKKGSWVKSGCALCPARGCAALTVCAGAGYRLFNVKMLEPMNCKNASWFLFLGSKAMYLKLR